MERQIPYIFHQADFSRRNSFIFVLLMYYCICVIMLHKDIYDSISTTEEIIHQFSKCQGIYNY